MDNEEYLRFRKRIQAEEGPTPPNDVAVSEVLKKLAEWGSEPHDSVCSGIHCRHDLAKEAIVEINNAVAECQSDHEAAEQVLEKLLSKPGHGTTER